MADREKLLEAVRKQEADIDTAARERDEVVSSVNKQREYMDFVMNGELSFLKMTASEEEQDLIKEQKVDELNERMAEFAVEQEILNRPRSEEEEAGDEEGDAEAAKEPEETRAAVEDEDAAVVAEDEADGHIGDVAADCADPRQHQVPHFSSELAHRRTRGSECERDASCGPTRQYRTAPSKETYQRWYWVGSSDGCPRPVRICGHRRNGRKR